MTDYHELSEMPRCCAGCVHWYVTVVQCSEGAMLAPVSMCRNLRREVEPHGLCSHWGRRDETS